MINEWKVPLCLPLILVVLVFGSGCLSKCDLIFNETEKSKCYVILAQETLDYRYCEKLNGTLKGRCYSYLAYCKDDFAKCNDVLREDYDALKRNNNSFDNMPSVICITEFAIEMKNISLCDTLPDVRNTRGPSTQTPREGCYLQFALDTKNDSICENIRFISSRDFCLEQIKILKEIDNILPFNNSTNQSKRQIP